MNLQAVSKQPRYVLLMLVALSIAMLFISKPVSALYTTAQIEARLSNGVATAAGWDTTCRNNLFNNIGIAGTNALRSSINGDGSYIASSYTDRSWISGRGLPNIQSPTPVTWGQTSIPLQINSVSFLCGPLVAPETYSTTSVLPKNPYSLNLYNQTGSSGRWVQSAADARDRLPNRIGTTNMRPARVDTLTRITGYTINRPGATLSGAGSLILIQRNNSSRYWFPSGPVNVTYTDPAGITRPTTVTIVMRYKVVQGYHALSGPTRVESCAGQALANNLNIDLCDEKTATLTITFAPTASLAATSTVDRAAVAPGGTATFTHRITKSGPGNANYVWRVCGGYSAAPVTTPTASCTGYSAASNNFTTTRLFTANAANSNQYYCERIAFAVNATRPEAGTSRAACTFIQPVGVSCGSFDTTPNGIDSATRFRATASVAFGAAYVPVNPTITLSFTPAIATNGNNMVASSVTGTLVQTGTGITGSFGGNAAQLGPTGATGVYTARWVYDDANLSPTTCTATFDVANKPYVAVYGGDVVVGESPTTSYNCYVNEDGGVYGWNNYTSNFRGAGSQYAVMALGTIQEFASTLGTATPDKLSFGNVDTGPVDPVHDVAAGLNGGMFGTTNTPCDFLSGVEGTYPQETGPSMNFPSPVNGQVVRYADGNVYISGNIAYATTAWANLALIPSFKLVVKGDIYIDNNVTQLDGTYVALSNEDGTVGGNIYTCATSVGNDVKPTVPNYFTDCRTKLTVNGAFVAKQVHLLRTMGTLGQSATDTPLVSNAAEVFNYSPELWLPRGNGNFNGRYMSITGLPPVL